MFSLYLKITLFLFISISLVLRYSWNLSPEYLCPLWFNFFVSILHFFYFPLKTIKLLLLIFILFYIFFYFSLKTIKLLLRIFLSDVLMSGVGRWEIGRGLDGWIVDKAWDGRWEISRRLEDGRCAWINIEGCSNIFNLF